MALFTFSKYIAPYLTCYFLFISWFISLLSSHWKNDFFQNKNLVCLFTALSSPLRTHTARHIVDYNQYAWNQPVNKYLVVSQVQLIPLEVSVDADPLLSMLINASLIPDITSRRNDCNCLLTPLVEPPRTHSSHYTSFICQSPPCPSGLAEASPPHPLGLLLLPSPLSYVNISFLPLTLTWPCKQTPSLVFTYVNLLTPAEFWGHKLVVLGVWVFFVCLFLIMPRENHRQSKNSCELNEIIG